MIAEPLKAQTIDPNLVPYPTNPTSQVPPPNLIPPPRTTPPPPPALPLPPNLIPPPQAPTTPQVPNLGPGTITVKRFEVVGSTVFSQQTLTKVTAPFTNRPISFAELLQARSAVTQLYIDNGYITSGALIPPQTFRGGVVRIQVVEGRVEEIDVTGTRRLSPRYVRSRLRRATSKPLNRNRLLEALQLLQLNLLIRNISAELSAGSRPGTSVLTVQITEAKTFIPQIILDNNRPPSIGSFERGFQLNEANLFGLGDGLSVGYANTDGSNDVTAGYTLPINSRNGTLNLSYGTTLSHVVEPPFNQLNINANFRYYDITLRQPVLLTPQKELALGLTASRRESDISLLGSNSLGRLLSPGADSQGRTRISALRFFQEWTSRNSQEVFAARSQFSVGLNALNATIHGNPPDGRFFAWLGQGQWARLLAPDTLLLIRADLQLADRPLVPLEQFGLGGDYTVRGYRQDFLLTDNAALASVEFRLPIYRRPLRQTVLQLAPFFDVGTGWNNSANTEPSTPNTNTLASIGLGLRLQLSDNLTARLDYGIPLIDVPSTKRTWQENGLYFSIIANPF